MTFCPRTYFLFHLVRLVDFLSTGFLTALLLFHEYLFNRPIFQNIRSNIPSVSFNCIDCNKLNKLALVIKLHGNFALRAEVGVDELKLAFT